MKEKIYMVLTNGFDPDVRVFKEAKYLKEVGYDVEVLCWDRNCFYEDRTIECIEGILIKRFHIKSVPGTGLKQMVPFVKYINTIKKYLKNKEYNYIHCHDFDGIIAGFFCTFFRKKKLIFDMHEIYNDFSYGKFGFIFNIVYKHMLKISKNIIYVNDEQIKHIHNKKIREKLVYLPNYPDIENYLPIEKRYNENKRLRINYVGYLRDYDSLKALVNLGEKNENILVGLYGTGTMYERIKNESTDKIKIYGKFDGVNDISEIYRNTDILYCAYNPQNYNYKTSYPVKFYEAIITQTPMIVSKNTKIEKLVIKDKIGEVIEYANEESIQNAINKITDNYERYIINIKKISEEYQWNNIKDNLKTVYI